MLAKNEIDWLRKTTEGLAGTLSGQIDTEAVIEGLDAVQLIITEAVKIGRKLIEKGAHDQIDYADEQAWNGIMARLEDGEGGCLRNVADGLRSDLDESAEAEAHKATI